MHLKCGSDKVPQGRHIMAMLRSPLLAIVVVGLPFPANGTARAENYRDDAHHYSFVLPADWVPMSTDAVAAINDLVNQRMPGRPVRYETGFQLMGQRPGSYPYILVQVQSHSTVGYSIDDIGKSFAKRAKSEVKRIEGELSDVASKLPIGDVAIDHFKNRVVMRTDAQVAGAGKIRGLSIGTIGAEGIVFLHAYAPQAQFEQYLPAFSAVIDSFRYDPGFTFVPMAASPRSSFRWKDAIGGGLAGAVICGIAGAITVLFWKGMAVVLRRIFKRIGST